MSRKSSVQPNSKTETKFDNDIIYVKNLSPVFIKSIWGLVTIALASLTLIGTTFCFLINTGELKLIIIAMPVLVPFISIFIIVVYKLIKITSFIPSPIKINQKWKSIKRISYNSLCYYGNCNIYRQKR